MAQPYLGEIRMFAGNFAPAGWMFLEGQLLPISENETLFQLIGTTYGGDGESTFALPNLQGRIPVHQGNNYQLAETGGVESATLTVSQIPVHSHQVLATSQIANSAVPNNGVLAVSSKVSTFISGSTLNQSMHAQAISPVGGSQPHNNFQPYLCINFIISLFGVFPSPS